MFHRRDADAARVTQDGAEFRRSYGRGNRANLDFREPGPVVRRKVIPLSTSAGQMLMLMGLPLWTPTPETLTRSLSVLCRGLRNHPMNSLCPRAA
jgi:hypothetical protein